MSVWIRFGKEVSSVHISTALTACPVVLLDIDLRVNIGQPVNQRAQITFFSSYHMPNPFVFNLFSTLVSGERMEQYEQWVE